VSRGEKKARGPSHDVPVFLGVIAAEPVFI